jgi:hypothetical protein
MSTSLIYGLAGIPCFILFCCLLACYKDIKENVRHRMEKIKMRKKEKQEWQQIAEREKNEAPILAEARRNIYEGSFQETTSAYSNHAHTPVI